MIVSCDETREFYYELQAISYAIACHCIKPLWGGKVSVDLNFLEQCWDERKTVLLFFSARKKSSHSNINKNQSTNLNNYTTLPFPLMQILLEKGASLPQNPQKNLINISMLKVTLVSVFYLFYGVLLLIS